MDNIFTDPKSAYLAYINHLHSSLGITPLEANILMMDMAFASILFSYNATHEQINKDIIVGEVEPVPVNQFVLAGSTGIIGDMVRKDLKQVIELQKLVAMNAEGRA